MDHFAVSTPGHELIRADPFSRSLLVGWTRSPAMRAWHKKDPRSYRKQSRRFWMMMEQLKTDVYILFI